MRTYLFIFTLLFCTSCTTGQVSYTDISKQELREVLKKANKIQLIDVRTPSEYEQGAIEGAVLINFWDENFLANITQQLDKDQPVYLYCKVGGRSSKAAKMLVDNGFKKVYSLEGGYTGWTKKE